MAVLAWLVKHEISLLPIEIGVMQARDCMRSGDRVVIVVNLKGLLLPLSSPKRPHALIDGRRILAGYLAGLVSVVTCDEGFSCTTGLR